jgi:hypothetical protein
MSVAIVEKFLENGIFKIVEMAKIIDGHVQAKKTGRFKQR